MKEMEWQHAFKCLAEASRLGISIDESDGHWWIKSQETYYDFDYHRHLEKHGVTVNNKIYHGILEALAVIDESLKMCGGKGLTYDTEYLGKFVSDPSRIEKVDAGKGGLQ